MKGLNIKQKLLTKDTRALNSSLTNGSNLPEPHSGSQVSRRWFGTGMFVVLLGGFLVRTAQAFPEGAQNHFKAATRILERYGLSISGAFDQTLGHDVLTVTSIPLLETQYDFVGSEVNPAGGVDPCWKTSSFQGATDFTAFEENQVGGIVPCTKTTVAAEQTIFEQLDTNRVGGIVPCSRTIIEEPLTTHMVFDPNVAGGIEPCYLAGAERKVDGTLGPVEVVVNDPELNFTVRIGPRIYRLVRGALVEESTS